VNSNNPDPNTNTKPKPKPYLLGEFKPSWGKKKLLEILHAKLQAPRPYLNVKEFLRAVKDKADAAGKKAVIAMSTTPTVSPPIQPGSINVCL